LVGLASNFIVGDEVGPLDAKNRVTTHLENLEKSGNWTVVWKKSGKMEKVRESYNHHLAAVREKDITAFLRYQSRHSSM